MKKTLFAVALLAATSASAGDLPQRYNAPQVYQNLFNWTGFYAGLNAGWGWGDANNADQSGYAIGGQIGYNHQLVSGMLFGVETDFSFTGIDGPIGVGAFSTDYIGTVRGRVGYAFDRIMLYGTAGLAYAGGDLAVGGLSNSQTHLGYALGLGVEGMITGNWSAKLEYLYTGFGRETYSTVFGPANVRFNSSLLRAGVNYRF